jgi:hypothetical protein
LALADARLIGRQSTSRTRFLRLSLAPVKISAIDLAFERALSAEIAASELLRVRVLAVTLAVLLVADELLFLFGRDLVEQFTQKPLPAWLPAQVIGPFLAYEIVALLVLHYRLARGSTFPTAARLANALIETSLPTVSLWWVNQFTTPAVAFGTWPTMLYFIFIVAATLRLDFVLPAFTGVVAAAGYLGVATWVLSFQGMATNPNRFQGRIEGSPDKLARHAGTARFWTTSWGLSSSHLCLSPRDRHTPARGNCFF